MYLGTGVGSTEEVADCSSSNSGRGTGITALNRRDGLDRELLLAKASFDVGDERHGHKNLVLHDVCGCLLER